MSDFGNNRALGTAQGGYIGGQYTDKLHTSDMQQKIASSAVNAPPQQPQAGLIIQGHEVINRRLAEIAARLERLSDVIHGASPQTNADNSKEACASGLVGAIESQFNLIGGNLSRVEATIARLERFA